MPRSSRRLLDPQDHGSLEDITLHAELGVLPLQLLETSALVDGQAFGLAPLDPVPIHPVAQRPRVDPQVPGNHCDRLAGLTHDPDRTLTELGVVLPSCLWHRFSSYAMPPRFRGMPNPVIAYTPRGSMADPHRPREANRRGCIRRCLAGDLSFEDILIRRAIRARACLLY